MTPKSSPTGGLVDTLRGQLTDYLTAQLESLTSKAGDKLTDLAGQLTDTAENGGPLPRIGKRILEGDSPMKAAVGEKAKDFKDKLMPGSSGDKGGGSSKEGPGHVKATFITERIDVGVPLRTAYDCWTQLEDFPKFTKGIRKVSRGDDVTTDWTAKIGPSTRSWTATVLEQIPDDRIVWTSKGARGSTHGAVSFHELGPTITRIVLVVEYTPAGFVEKFGNIWRVEGRRMRLDFKHFQRYVTFLSDEPEGWRGEVRDGEVVRSHEDAVAEEEEQESQESEEGEEPEDAEEGTEEDGEEGEDAEDGEDGEEEGEDEEDEDQEYEDEDGEDEEGEDEEEQEDEEEDDDAA